MTPISVLLIPLVPSLLYFALRFFIRTVLQVKLGFGSLGTDVDFVPHLVVSSSLLLMTVFRSDYRFQLQKKTLLYCALSLSTFLCVSILFTRQLSYENTAFMVLWFSLAGFTLASSFFLFLRVRDLIDRSGRGLLCAVLGVGFSGILANTALHFAGNFLTRLTGLFTYGLMKPAFPSLEFALKQVSTVTGMDLYSALTYNNFTVAIGQGCAGLQGISLFVTVLGLFYIVQNRNVALKKALLLLPIGLSYMFVLNIFRIVLFFVLTLAVKNVWGEKTALYALDVIFHNGLGFVVYCVGLGIFFGTWLKLESLARLPFRERETVHS